MGSRVLYLFHSPDTCAPSGCPLDSTASTCYPCTVSSRLSLHRCTLVRAFCEPIFFCNQDILHWIGNTICIVLLCSLQAVNYCKNSFTFSIFCCSFHTPHDHDHRNYCRISSHFSVSSDSVPLLPEESNSIRNPPGRCAAHPSCYCLCCCCSPSNTGHCDVHSAEEC